MLRDVKILSILGLGLLATTTAPAAGPMGDAAGVVIERVMPRSVAATAGLEPGDVLLSWSTAASPPALPQAASGDLHTPYDLLPLEIEESPRRAVVLHGRRGDAERVWVLAAGDWEIEARPALPAALAALPTTDPIPAEEVAAVERGFHAAAAAAQDRGDAPLAAWLLEHRARVLAAAERWTEADAAFGEALTALAGRAETLAAAELLRGWGESFKRRGDWEGTLERYRQALALATTPKSLAAARSLDRLGVQTAQMSRYDDARQLLEQALAIREELAPGTPEIADSLNHLGILARLRGDFAAAEEHLRQAEALQARGAPGNLRHALILMNRGNVAQNRDDLDQAETLLRQALALWERIDPGGVGGVLQNLSILAVVRGDLAGAEELYRRILDLEAGRTPAGPELWRLTMSLGDLAAYRGDLEAALPHYRQGLTLAEALFPDGREVALSLGRLGRLASARGDRATARSYLTHAQKIDEKRAPGSPDVAEGLNDLACLELWKGGDLAKADRLLRRALAILETRKPEGLVSSLVLRHLGEVAARRGRFRAALSFHRRALALQSRLAPGNAGEAEILHLLGRTERRAGRLRDGVGHLCRAIDVLDRQRARLGGLPEARTAFEAGLDGYHPACVDGLVALGRPAAAFHALERGRARSFLSLLAERDLHLDDLPPELAARRRQVNAEYDRAWSRLAPLRAGRDDAEIERVTERLRDLRVRQQEIAAQIRREAPRSAALVDPQPLDLAAARRALDPGTVLLEYAVGEERSWLFVVEPAGAGGSGLSVFPIALGSWDLRARVERFRRQIKDPGSDAAELKVQDRRLYDLLVRPAEARIAGARRLLLSADGPLHALPFAALVRGERYLAQWRPLHSVLSATVYAEIARSRRPRRASGEERLVAFAPGYEPLPEAAADPGRDAARRDGELAPLSRSVEEARSIAALFPAAQVYLGREATEERAKSLGPEARFVHFACHGLLDERFPMSSALALSRPEPAAEGRDNGLLQAWEIFESVRLDADLVTLSACDTALGREMGGEGLVGLTRAFQYAGARSVLATLWGVADLSTARFMERFYGHLRAGLAKDEALRAAQIDQMRDTALSHPFHWAAFQLTGDWR